MGARTQQKVLADLSKLYTWARRKEIVGCDNPVRGVERPPTQPSLDFFSREEVQALLAHLEKHHADTLYPMVAFAIFVGARKGEIMGLLWRDVHLDAPRVDILRSYRTTPKNGKPRHVPLNPEVVRILRAWKNERCPTSEEGLAFPFKEGEGAWRMSDKYEMRGLREAMKEAKVHVPSRPWHCLRHTFASHYMMSGGNILELQKLLGHASLAMTQVYAHLSPDHLAAGIARMSFAPKKPADVASMDDERRKRAAHEG